MAPRLRVLGHESELGAWELVRRAPAPGLRGYVIEYEGYDERGAAVQVQRQQVPVARLPLIVNFGSRWSASAAPDGARELHDSFFAGMFDRSTYVSASGAASCAQVNLTPFGAHLLFGLPMHEVAIGSLRSRTLCRARSHRSTSGSGIKLTGKAASGSSTRSSPTGSRASERPLPTSRGPGMRSSGRTAAFRSDGSATGSAAAVAT